MLDLEPIKARLARYEYVYNIGALRNDPTITLADICTADVPALVTEVERLRAEVSQVCGLRRQLAGRVVKMHDALLLILEDVDAGSSAWTIASEALRGGDVTTTESSAPAGEETI